jgi:predicted dehydrogenase
VCNSNKQIRLGIIGVSENNGHPYSWSAIINGYHKELMIKCPYPAIPDYLAKHEFPREQLKKAKVTHIWTQDQNESVRIAEATKISNVVKNPNEMIRKIDAILLARDDYNMHKKLATPFIKANIPIYIDKPLAINIKSAEELLDLQLYEGQIYTGSAITWDPGIIKIKNLINSLGKIVWINGIVPGPWDKYSIHLIDPILSIIGKTNKIKKFNVIKGDGCTNLQAVTDDNIQISLNCTGRVDAPFRILFVGTDQTSEIEIDDVFFAFKESLNKFIDSIKTKIIVRSREEVLNSIKWVSMAC